MHDNISVPGLIDLVAYRATIPYLLEQKHPNSTWTICTGAQGHVGMRASPAISQGMSFEYCWTNN
jgi:hypothetical protein